MICPNCKSSDFVVRTTSTKTTRIELGLFFKKRLTQETCETINRCLDCGVEWDGQAKTEGSSQAVGIKFRCMFCGKEFDTVEACNVCEESH